MAKKLKAVIPKLETDKEKEAALERWSVLKAEVKERDDEIKLIQSRFLSTLSIRESFTYGVMKVNIMQNWGRKIDWKSIAAALAKRLFTSPDQWKAWLRKIAKDYPKKPTKPFAKFFELKDNEASEDEE